MPSTYDFNFVRGDTFNLKFNFKDSSDNTLDLSAWTSRLKIKQKDGTVIASLSEGSGITLDSASPNVTVYVADTSAWPIGKALYDLELTSNASPAITTTDPQGTINIIADVTD